MYKDILEVFASTYSFNKRFTKNQIKDPIYKIEMSQNLLILADFRKGNF